MRCPSQENWKPLQIDSLDDRDHRFKNKQTTTTKVTTFEETFNFTAIGVNMKTPSSVLTYLNGQPGLTPTSRKAKQSTTTTNKTIVDLGGQGRFPLVAGKVTYSLRTL